MSSRQSTCRERMTRLANTKKISIILKRKKPPQGSCEDELFPMALSDPSHFFWHHEFLKLLHPTSTSDNPLSSSCDTQGTKTGGGSSSEYGPGATGSKLRAAAGTARSPRQASQALTLQPKRFKMNRINFYSFWEFSAHLNYLLLFWSLQWAINPLHRHASYFDSVWRCLLPTSSFPFILSSKVYAISWCIICLLFN